MTTFTFSPGAPPKLNFPLSQFSLVAGTPFTETNVSPGLRTFAAGLPLMTVSTALSSESGL